jgi:two-component system cell cycle response regulator
MIDLDHFKEVNDRFGHGTGDAVLAEVARRLRVAARPADSVARFGGEEFVVVLPDCAESDALVVGERLRDRVAAAPIVIGQSVQVNVTCSIGVATADLYPRIQIGGSAGLIAGGTDAILTPLVTWAFPNQSAIRARIA